MSNTLSDISFGDVSINDENVVKHYGVLGQRWGYRKDRSTGTIRKTTPKEQRASRAAAKKRSNTLASNPDNRRKTTAELQKDLERLILEQKIKDLQNPGGQVAPAKPKTNHKDRIKKMAEDVAYDVAKGALTEVGRLALSQALRTNYNSRVGSDYKIGVPKPKK